MAHWVEDIYTEYAEYHPCDEARIWAKENCEDLAEFWDTCDRGDWMIWYLLTVVGADEASLDLNREYDEYINKPEADKTENDLEKLKELSDIIRNNITL